MKKIRATKPLTIQRCESGHSGKDLSSTLVASVAVTKKKMKNQLQ